VLHEGDHAVVAGAAEGADEELGVLGIPGHPADQRLKDVGPGRTVQTEK
jgi:hypothetical protein